MPQDELVDIVDENMNFIKVVSKKEAHAEGLLHKCVIGQVFDLKGNYLFVKQPRDRQDPGRYVSPMGGHVSAGEKNEDALRRELMEELGIKDYRYELMGTGVYNREVIGRKENHLFVLYKVLSNETPILSHEAESCRYFSKNELKKELQERPEQFGGAFHFLWKRFFPELL